MSPASKAFAVDLGDFDPTFPGVTLHYANEDVWKTVGALTGLYASFALRDMARTNPTVRASDVTPQQIAEQLKQMDFTVPLTSEEKDRLGENLIAHDPERAVETLATVTAYEHERRHFHDWLLSPYTAGMNAMRAEIAFNFSGAYAVLRAGGTTVIPVPLGRWLRKSPQEREALLAEWRALLPESVLLQVPALDRPDLLAVIDDIERRYRSLAVLFEPLGPPGLTASVVLEASALLVQTQAIHDLFGDAASRLFFQRMTGTPGTRYAWVLGPMAQFLKRGEVLENDTLTALVTWCQLGSTDVDAANAHPVTRLLHVFEYLQARGFPDVDMPARQLFDALDAASGAASHAECLARSVALGEEVVAQLGAAAPGAGTFAQGAAQAHAHLHDLHRYMVGVFMEDPDRYAKPVPYLDTNLERWPEPPIRETFGRPFLRLSPEAAARYAGVTWFPGAGPDTACVRQRIGPGVKESVNLQLADNWQYACSLADAVFAESDRDAPGVAFHRDRTRKAGLHLLEVIA